MGYTVIINKLWDLPNAEVMDLSRAITKNNQGIFAHYNIATTEKFLPHVLVQLGLFVSGSQVKKNRPDLWKDVEDAELVEVGKIIMRIHKCDHIIEIDHSKIKPYGHRLIEAHKRVWKAIEKLGLK